MNDNSLGIREAQATVVASELDVAMQPYIDSGNYSSEELAKIRKRLSNQLKAEKEQKKKVKEQKKTESTQPTIVQPTTIKNEKEKATVQKSDLEHIKFEDLRGKDPTFWESMWTSEEDVYDSLREHYRDKGVRFEQVGGFSDQIWVKNKAGQKQTFQLPSIWNKNKMNLWAQASDVLTGTGEQEFKDWEGFHKGITDFIDQGNKNIDPELAQQQTDVRRDLDEILNNDDEIRKIIPDWDGDWVAMSSFSDDKRGEEEQDNLKKALLKDFGSGTDAGFLGENWWFRFNEEWDKLDEEDVEFAIEDIIELKATEQGEERADTKRKLKNYYLPTDAVKSKVHQHGEESEVAKFNEKEKILHSTFNEYQSLIGLEDEKSVNKRAVLKKKMDIYRDDLTYWFNSKEMFVLDKNGNWVDDVRKGQDMGQMVISKEEMQDRKNTLQDQIGGRRGGIRDASNRNFENLHVSDQVGEETYDVVINNASVYATLVDKYNIKPHDKTNNGHVFRVPKHVLADNYNYMIAGDGFDMFKDFVDIGIKYGEADPGQFDTPDGYFGLLEHDDKQDFSWVEKEFGRTRLGPVIGSLWDTDEYSDVDLSKGFKRELKTWRDERKNLVADRKILNDMHLLNIDPGSNSLSFELDLNPWEEGKSTFSLDIVPRSVETLYEGFGHTLGFDSNAQEDLNLWSARTANDHLERFADSSPAFELNDEQKERIKRTGTYKVFEGVTGFVPAITEFAAIELASGGIASGIGIPRLALNLTRTYRMGMEGAAMTARQVAGKIGYTGSFGGAKWEEAILVHNNLTKAGRAAPIVANSPKFFSVNSGLYHGFRILKEEAKMKLAFEDDYKMGMGAGFYIAGASLPRFSFDKKSIFGRHANRLNSGLTLGRSGVAGATGVATATQLEEFIEDVRGNTTYGKFLKDEYDDIQFH